MRRKVQDLKYLPYYEVINLIEQEIAAKDKPYAYSQALTDFKSLLQRTATVVEFKIVEIEP